MNEEPKRRRVNEEEPRYPENEWEAIFANSFEQIKERFEKAIQSISIYETVADETAAQVIYTTIGIDSQPFIKISLSRFDHGTQLKVHQLGRYSTYNIFLNNIFRLIAIRSQYDQITIVGNAPTPLLDKMRATDPALQAIFDSRGEVAVLIGKLGHQVQEAPNPTTNTQGPQQYTAADAIKIYQKRKRQEKLLTLKKVCEELGLNYGSVRVAKARIDKQKKTKKKR